MRHIEVERRRAQTDSRGETSGVPSIGLSAYFRTNLIESVITRSPEPINPVSNAR